MATGDYCTLNELKLRIWPDGTTPDTANDVMLQSIITATSRFIDNHCGRRFYTTSADETRVFSTQDKGFLWPEFDVISVTSIKVDYNGDRSYSVTLDTTDYDLMPYNNALDSRPYEWVQISPLGSEVFPTWANGVQIVGKFGWSAVPAAVKEATLIQAMRIWQRRNAPFGILSNPVGGEMRLITQLDPDVQVMLWPYRKWV